MKKYFLATVSVLALSTASRAADLPMKAGPYAPVGTPVWTGLYLGIQGGVARHDATIDTQCFTDCASFDRSKTGGALGGVIGYNLQQGSFVYGLEGDWNWIGTNVDQRNVGGIKTANDVKWLATVRGRAGLAFDATLAYFSGGVAFGAVKNSFAALDFDNGSPFGSFSESKTRVGWTVGVGIEHAFSQHWTARAEFRYVDLGRSSVSCVPGLSTFCADFNYRSEFSNTLMMGLVGLNYKF